MATGGEPGTWMASFWQEGGMPVIGSSLALSCVMVHDGVIRRSEDAFSDTTIKGTSAMIALDEKAVCLATIGCGWLIR